MTANVEQDLLSVLAEVNPPSRIRALPNVAKTNRRRKSSPFRKADISRSVDAVARAGIAVGIVEVTPEGNLRIYAAGQEPRGDLFDKWADKL